MISVVIPVYNAEKYLNRCLDSILSSSCQDFEILLINDGSTDGSPKICQDYSRQDTRIRVISQPNQGVSAARNRGLEEAGGEWVVFVDSDDFISEDFLSLTARKEYQDLDMILYHFAVLSSSASCACPEGPGTESLAAEACFYRGQEMSGLISRILVPRPLAKDRNADFRTPCARAYKKQIIDQYSLRFSPDIRIGEDLLFNLEYQLRANSCAYIPKTVYYYDYHEDSSSHHFNPALHENHARLLQAVMEVLEQCKVFPLLEQDFYSYALENLTYVLIREIFNPFSSRTYRENCVLCKKIRQNEIYQRAMKHNFTSGILPRRILVLCFRLKCCFLTRLISGISYRYLEHK